MSQIFLPVMLWPPEVQENFHFMKHKASGKGGNCRWTILVGKKQQLWQHEEKLCMKSSKTCQNSDRKMVQTERSTLYCHFR